MFEKDPVWEAVHERDRKDVFDDVIFFLGKKEKEEEKELRNRNRKLMTQVYNNMASITYRTTWAEVSCKLTCNIVWGEGLSFEKRVTSLSNRERW